MEKPQLFLFHFAGGSRYSFYFMNPFLTDFEIVPIELPGRGKRISEPFITDFNRAADDLFFQLKDQLRVSRFAIYGHSLGAYFGFKVSLMLERINKSPSCLIVSGNPGPGIGLAEDNYRLPDVEFIELLKGYGGMTDEIIADDELLNLILPVLRADFQLAEFNNLKESKPIISPIFAIMGNKEERVGCISNWKNYTVSKFGYEVLSGRHFFIFDHAYRISQIIKSCFSI